MQKNDVPTGLICFNKFSIFAKNNTTDERNRSRRLHHGHDSSSDDSTIIVANVYRQIKIIFSLLKKCVYLQTFKNKKITELCMQL